MGKQATAKKQPPAKPPTYEMHEDEPFGQKIAGAKTISESQVANGEPFSAPLGIPLAPVAPASRFTTEAERQAEQLRLAQWVDCHAPMIQRRSLTIVSVGESGCLVACKSCDTGTWLIPTDRGPSEKSMACPNCQPGMSFSE
jgi:hypothetical protein